MPPPPQSCTKSSPRENRAAVRYDAFVPAAKCRRGPSTPPANRLRLIMAGEKGLPSAVAGGVGRFEQPKSTLLQCMDTHFGVTPNCCTSTTACIPEQYAVAIDVPSSAFRG